MNNTAQHIVAFSVAANVTRPTFNWRMVCSEVDVGAVHHYGASNATHGAYIGTRFTDGSAITMMLDCQQPVEFLGLFAAEQEAEPEVTAPKGWDEVQA